MFLSSKSLGVFGSVVFAQDPSPAGQAPNQTAVMITNIIPLFFVFIVFYFLLIRPQQKNRKTHEEMIKSLEKNDEVVTSSGIYGTIVGIKDDTVLLRIAENVKIEIQKSAISQKRVNKT